MRPYRLLCAICALGEADSGPGDAGENELLAAVRREPDAPWTLVCNVGEVFAHQDPGSGDDTPEGPDFNLRRDLEILHRLNLFPGATLPARILFSRLLDQIDGLSEICVFDEPTAEAWRGCPQANRGRYARGRAKGIAAIVPPRPADDMRCEKEESLRAMGAADTIFVRPHVLLCSVCQYGRGVRPPFPEDNLPELLALVLEKPETTITLMPHADWMMCAPCPSRVPALNACVNNRGSGGLPNQMRDLRVLQKLGLVFGATLKARDLYRLILDRIPGTLDICRIDQARPSVWWTGCGAATEDSEAYREGLRLLRGAMDCRE